MVWDSPQRARTQAGSGTASERGKGAREGRVVRHSGVGWWALLGEVDWYVHGAAEQGGGGGDGGGKGDETERREREREKNEGGLG